MEIENKLISGFYFSFWLYFAVSIAFTVGILLLILFRDALLINYNHSKTSKIGLCIVIFLALLGLIFFAYRFTLHCMDLKNIEQRNYETITGKVIGYSSIRSGNDPREPILGDPIFEIIGTGERIRFNVGPTKIDATYTLIYFKHSKVAVILSNKN